MKPKESNTKPRPISSDDIKQSAASMALGILDSKSMIALIEGTKIQLQVYTNFINLGCNEIEAKEQTMIFMAALLRSSNNPN